MKMAENRQLPFTQSVSPSLPHDCTGPWYVVCPNTGGTYCVYWRSHMLYIKYGHKDQSEGMVWPRLSVTPCRTSCRFTHNVMVTVPQRVNGLHLEVTARYTFGIDFVCVIY